MNELDLLLEPLEIVKQRIMDSAPPDIAELAVVIKRQDFREHAAASWAISDRFHELWDKAAEAAGWKIAWVVAFGDMAGYFTPQWSQL